MSGIRHLLRIAAGSVVGGAVGLGATVLVDLFIFHTQENTAVWAAIIGAIHGAIMAEFGWKYWVALGNDAADLVDDQTRFDSHRIDKEFEE